MTSVELKQDYGADFEALVNNGGGDPHWILPVRRRAMDRFQALGFPTTREEDWRFTNVAPIAHTPFQPAGEGIVSGRDLAPFIFGHPEWTQLVFVNGRYAAALSSAPALPTGAKVGSLGSLLVEDSGVLQPHLSRHAPVDLSGFSALNTAFMQDGGVVYVPANVTLERPVHLVFMAAPDAGGTVAHPRNLIVLGAGARASVIESYVSLAPVDTYFTNAVTEVVNGAGAWLEHTRIQRESERAYHVGFTHVDQARDSHYRSFTLAMGGAIARHNLHVRLNAPNIETLLYGLYLSRGEQLVDNHTAIFHDQPNCNSWEVYKGVLEDRSHAVFNGKVFVKPEAQKTDAKQTNRNLLLSDGARVDTKPQLEIFADDVKCTHGAAVGRLDDLALFYLRSRGIGSEEARKLLTYAFAAEVLEEVVVDAVRLELERLVQQRFEQSLRPLQ